MEIPVTFLSDDKGYFDRECPNQNCLYVFKINMQDWKEKISDDCVYCPRCGHTAKSTEWWTEQQLEGMQNLAKNWAITYLQQSLDKSFGKLANSTKNNKFFRITYKPSKKITFINNPIGQSKEWEQDIQCPYCSTRYSVIGTAYFCPCCGKNIIDKTFDNSIDNVEKMINSLNEMEALYTKSYGKDKAKNMCSEMLEGTLEDIVSAFQIFAATIYGKISSKNVRTNDFQIIEKGSNLFYKISTKKYEDFISKEEIKKLVKMFQQRHVFEHNGGVVDEDYLKKSGDTTYKLGQRLVLHKKDVFDTINIIRKLAAGLNTLKENKNET